MNGTARVWAPRVAKVDLVIGDEAHPMVAEDGGWWSAELPRRGPRNRTTTTGSDWTTMTSSCPTRVRDGSPPGLRV